MGAEVVLRKRLICVSNSIADALLGKSTALVDVKTHRIRSSLTRRESVQNTVFLPFQKEIGSRVILSRADYVLTV